MHARLALLIAVGFLTNVASGGARVAVPLQAVSLGASPQEVGLLLSCYAVFPVALSIHAGRWVDRLGPRNPLRVGLALLAGALVVPSLIGGLAGLAISAALCGAFGALVLIANNNTAGRISDERTRSTVYTAASMGMSAAQFAGPPLAGLCIDHLGFRTTFFVVAAIAVVAFVVALAGGRLIPTGGQGTPAAARRLTDLVTLPGMRAVFIVTTLLPISWDMFFFFLPQHGTSLGLSATTIGLVYSCLSITVFASRAAVPLLTRRAGEWSLVAVALAAGGIVFLLFPLTGSAGSMMGLALLLGCGMGLSHPVMLSITYSSAPPGRQGEAMGLRNVSINLVQLVVPISLGALAGGVGLAAALWPFAVLLLVGARYAMSRPPP